MSNQIETCRIWSEGYEAVGQSIPETGEVEVMESERAGGGYTIAKGAGESLDRLNDLERAQLTTWLVDQRLQGNTCPTVAVNVIEYVTSRSPLPIHARADRLLRFLSKQTSVVGQSVSLLKHSGNRGMLYKDAFGSPIYPEWPTNPIVLSALAWSESITLEEVVYLAQYLEEEGWVRESTRRVPGGTILHSYEYQVTVGGHARIADEAASIDSSKAFVAMWFGDPLTAAYDEGIAPAIRDCGFEPKRIDRDPKVDKIDDAIVAAIRQSRFLVADFTHGNDGVRGGVYYEAGFAHGLGIPVIFTCRGDMINELHFDTRQYAHIVWNSTSELRNSLRDRILARIGNGPSINQ